MTPEQEARYALNFGLSRGDLSMAAQLEYDRLKAEAPAAESAEPSRPRFPSEPATRRQILESIASRGGKYAKPFDSDGTRISNFSLIGTESWSDYGAVILQMAILDTLLSIEEKLTKLTEQSDDS
jgi:hypothetical protein